MVVALTLLLQGEPPRDVVQLGRAGQVDEDLRGVKTAKALITLIHEGINVKPLKGRTSPKKSLEEHLS